MSVKTYTGLQSCLKRVFSYLLIPSILSNLMSYHRSIDGDNDFSKKKIDKKKHNSDPVSVCVLLYGIILIQILIKYNEKKISLLHAPDYMILTPKIEKSPYRGTVGQNETKPRQNSFHTKLRCGLLRCTQL